MLLLFDSYKDVSFISLLQSDFVLIWSLVISRRVNGDLSRIMQALLPVLSLFLFLLSSPADQKLSLVSTKNGSAYLVSKTSKTGPERHNRTTSNDYSGGSLNFLHLKKHCHGQSFSINILVNCPYMGQFLQGGKNGRLMSYFWHELMCPSSWKLYVDDFPFFLVPL